MQIWTVNVAKILIVSSEQEKEWSVNLYSTDEGAITENTERVLKYYFKQRLIQ